MSHLCQHRKSASIALITLAALGFVASCGDAASEPDRTIATVVIVAAPSTLEVGDERTVGVRLLDAQGEEMEGPAPQWSSLEPSVATIDGTGRTRAQGIGVTTIRAEVEGKSASFLLTVRLAAVARIELSTRALTLEEGEVAGLTATLKDAAGRVLEGRPVTWSSDDPTIVAIDGAGRLTARRPGSTAVTVSAEGMTTKAEVTVREIPVAWVGLNPGAFVLELGESRQMQALVRDAQGRELLGRPVSWSVEGGNAIITPTGLVTGVRRGYSQVSATVGGKTAGVAVTVTVGDDFVSDLLFDRGLGAGLSELYTLTPGQGLAPVKLNAGNVSRHPSPAPNGQRIAFAVSMQDLTTRVWMHDLYAVDRNGLNMRRLTFLDGEETEPSWSPNGARIAFTHVRPNGRSDIWVMNADGTEPVNLTAEMSSGARRVAASWSPDGSRIAFSESNYDLTHFSSSIYTMRPDGSDKQRISFALNAWDSKPSWSPNGLSLVFSRYWGDGDTDLAIVPSNGGTVRRITMPGTQSAPAWSVADDLIAFVQLDGVRQNVYTMRPDGSRVRLQTLDQSWSGASSIAWIRR